MKFSALWKSVVLLSATATSPGALAADPQIDFKTSLGTIRVELYPEKAPKTVANFLQYVRDGHYKETLFHRVIDGFMIQGGGFDTAFSQKSVRASIENEAALGVKGGLRNEPGTLAMARTSDPHSATAQFFINLKANGFLDAGSPQGDGVGYAVFGKVVSGMDVVTKIAKSSTGSGGPFPKDVPQPAVVIESADVVGAAN